MGQEMEEINQRKKKKKKKSCSQKLLVLVRSIIEPFTDF
jgi:hypothetical protein